ncbi:hypothetical protein [Nocardiopsis sp. NPDC006832]|uniref:hypothetical protein n=1 Tax=Nocardiopsis sp. NPDC006832 TaxID=3157188 RepID=UPI0033E5272D
MASALRDTRPPASVRAQRVLLWIYAVMFAGNAIWAIGEAGGGMFGVGFSMPYLALAAVSALLTVKVATRGRWVRTSIIVLHSFLIVIQLGRTLGGDVYGLIGLIIAITGLVLALRPTARGYFSVVPVRT